MKRIVIVGALGLVLCGFAIAQVHRSGGLRHVAGHHGHGNAASMAKHLGEAFPRFARFDANKGGILDTIEKEAVAKAIAGGTLELPAHRPPDTTPEGLLV